MERLKTEFVVGPGTKYWSRILGAAKKNPHDGYNCAIGATAQRHFHDLARVDPEWSRAKVYVNYSHQTGEGTFSVTRGNWRYTRPLTREEVDNIVVPFDTRVWAAVQPTVIEVDLLDPAWTRVPKRQAPRIVVPTEPAGNTDGVKTKNAAWARRRRSIERLVNA